MKRIVSIILAALMLLSLLPYSALAESAALPGDEPVIPSEVEGSVPASVIPSEVEGSIPDSEEDSLSLPPIAENMATSGGFNYTVEDGKAILFSYFGPGGDVIIPPTLGGYPVTVIGEETFCNCTSLASITIPNSVTYIGGWAFEYCMSLASITIPASVTAIGEGAFSFCSNLESITVEEGNPVYHSVGNCLIETESKTLIAGCKTSVIPTDGSVTTIGESAFSGCMGLTAITIPASVTTIGIYAFYGCASLTSVTIPNSVTTIGGYAFYGCASLTSVTIPDGVTAINFGTFKNCTKLRSIVIPDSITMIRADAFSGCTSLECNTYDNARYIGSASNPYYLLIGAINKEISSCVIHPNTVVIGIYAFSDCKNFESVIIPDCVTTIGEGAFFECTALTSIAIPNSVTAIGDGAFAWCKNLTSITIPKSVTTIGDGAFWNCSSLTTVYYSGTEEQWKAIEIMEEKYPLLNANIIFNYNPYAPESDFEYTVTDGAATITKYLGPGGDVLIPPTLGGYPVTAIGDRAFLSCASLVSITIPNGVTTIGAGAFSECTGLTEIVIPNNVTSIDLHAFSYCSGLTSVTIGNCVTSIGNYSFYGCSSLSSIAIPDSVTFIGSSAFGECTGLTEITIPDSVTSIGKASFEGCTSLASITIGSAVSSIGRYAFAHCTSLSVIEIPESVVDIGNSPFLGCTALESITVAAGNPVYHSVDNCLIETESKALIAGCKNSMIPADGSVTTIGYGAFGYCSGLTSILFPDSVTSIGDYAFYECTGLPSVIFPNSVTSIGEYAFAWCANLYTIVIPDSVVYVGENAFLGCPGWASSHEHSWSEPTYTWSGDYGTCTALRTCSGCGETESETVTASVETILPATCTEAGTKVFTAAFTLAVFETQTKTVETSALGHEYRVTFVLPTCTLPGFTRHSCARCGHSYVDGETPATGHAPSDWIIDLEPTETEAGRKHKECLNCEELLVTEEIPPLGGPVGPGAAIVTVESKTVNPGREFTVAVTITNNPGVMALTLLPAFSQGLTLVKAENGNLLPDFTGDSSFFWVADSDVTQDGILFTLTFTTTEDLACGEYVVDLRVWDSADSQENDVPFTVNYGVITVKEIVWGDANGDGVVNNKDIIRLKNYLANLDPQTGASTVEIFAGADANGDGVVNAKDVVRLKNYFATLDPVTGLPRTSLGPALGA